MSTPAVKTALVTGASRRLGAFLARHLAGRGWNLILHYHTHRIQAEDLAESLARLYPESRFTAVGADLTEDTGAETLVRTAAERSPTGSLDTVVHGACSWAEDSWQTAEQSVFETQYRVQVWSLVVFARFLAAQDRPSAPHLVALLDARLASADPRHFSYISAKAAAAHAVNRLALEAGPRLRVNALAPGLLLKPDDLGEETWQSWAAASPLQTVGSPGDLLAAFDYLEAAPYVTGQILYTDGGRHLKGGLGGF